MKCADRQLHERFFTAIEEHHMLNNASHILVALSGGADSTALLLLLNELAKERTLTLAALHVNHMLRGDESDRDEAFCRALCASLGIPLHVERADIKALAATSGRGIEETARDFRYSVIRTLCAVHGYDCAAFAHNADDNAETILFHLTRGSSLKGMRGIPPIRREGDCLIIRPLILCEKQLIREALTERGQAWVEDSTNADIHYTRNRIRSEVIPALKTINPSLTDTITAFAKMVARDDDTLDELAKAHRMSEGRTSLASLDDAILSRLLYREWNLHKICGQLGSRHITDMMRLLRGNSPHAALSLPGKVTFTLERECVTITGHLSEAEQDFTIPLLHGVNQLPNHALIYAFPRESSADFAKDINTAINIYKLAIPESLDSGKIKGAIYIRTRQESDRIFCGGMHHKVKTLFSDRKLPSQLRRRYPILCDDEGILIIPGIACRDGVKASPDTEAVLTLYYFAPEA